MRSAGLSQAQGGERETKRFLRAISREAYEFEQKKDCFKGVQN